MTIEMREVRLEKAVINIGVGEAGERLLKAEKVLKMVTGRKPIRTVAKTTNRDLGIRKGMQIGCKVTIRGDDAFEFVKKALYISSLSSEELIGMWNPLWKERMPEVSQPFRSRSASP